MNTRLTIVLPVYNEGKNIVSVINAIQTHITTPKEILVVYDFDGDDTIPVVKNIHNTQVKLVKGEGGLIRAIQAGFARATGEYVVVMPADRADDPRVINHMLAKAEAGYDIVCATRYGKGGKKIGGGFLKTVLSRMAGMLTPLLLGIPITDISNGYKLYTLKLIREIPITSNGGWEFAAELTIKAFYKGYKITEVPAVWRNRVSGVSKFHLMQWLPKYMYWYMWGITKRIGL